MTKHVFPPKGKSATPAKIDAAIAATARQLIALVRQRIDIRGRVDPDLLASIKLDHGYVSASFIDYPDEYGDIVAWRQQR
jgi:hypothetical protein